MAQTVKNLPAMQETWVQSLAWEDPLEKETATHSAKALCCLQNSKPNPSILAWGKTPWAEEPSGLRLSDSHTHTHTHTHTN